MTEPFRLLMLSAMYENGGNTTHRFFDGHPQMFVYPFESQLGTRLVSDALASTFPVKYRWPVFDLGATAQADYASIIDEETRVRARTPHVSKFRHVAFDFSDDDRAAIYARHVAATGRSRASNVAAFFRATFEAWKDVKRTAREIVYVGYSPIIVVDAAKILGDFSESHVVHVVRNPWSAYADTKKRPAPLSLESYLLGWTINQYHAVLFRDRFPGRMSIVRAEDVFENPVKTLGPICRSLGLDAPDSLKEPSWNGSPLAEVYPWGTIRNATPFANRATAGELTEGEASEIRSRAGAYLETFDYKSFR